MKDLNQGNQRLDGIINKMKNLMKTDLRGKKAGVSPLGKMGMKVNEKDKSSKRLIERVEKAITQQGLHHSTK